MHAAKQVPVAQFVKILAYSLWRDVVAPCQIIDRDAAGGSSKRYNLVLSDGQVVHLPVSPPLSAKALPGVGQMAIFARRPRYTISVATASATAVSSNVKISESHLQQPDRQMPALKKLI